VAEPAASSRPAEGWNRRRERVSREIERAALTQFVRSGAETATVEDIAAAAGISVRTFFRYFASKDEVLAALPRREIQKVCEHIRRLPPSQSVFEVFSTEALEAESLDPDERELILLFGLAVHRSPDEARRALAGSTVNMIEVFHEVVAERLGLAAGDPRAGALAAAFAGVVGFTYSRWVETGGRTPLVQALAEMFTALQDVLAEQLTPADLDETAPRSP
jgi:AcrR family transcriptional regulator